MYIDLDIIGITDEQQGFVIKEAVELTLLRFLPDCDDVLTVQVEVAEPRDIGDAHGLVDDMDDLEYVIYLNQSILDDDVELFRTVVHECVHIKQYFNKELEHVNLYRTLFNGKVVDHFVTKYEERPWEIEAFKAEEEMIWQLEKKQQLDI